MVGEIQVGERPRMKIDKRRIEIEWPI